MKALALACFAGLAVAAAPALADKPKKQVVDDEDPLSTPAKKPDKPDKGDKKKPKVEYVEDAPDPKKTDKADKPKKSAKPEYVEDDAKAKKDEPKAKPKKDEAKKDEAKKAKPDDAKAKKARPDDAAARKAREDEELINASNANAAKAKADAKKPDDAKAKKAKADDEAKLTKKIADDAKAAKADKKTDDARLARKKADDDAKLARKKADDDAKAAKLDEARAAKKRDDDAKAAKLDEARATKKRDDDAKLAKKKAKADDVSASATLKPDLSVKAAKKPAKDPDEIELDPVVMSDPPAVNTGATAAAEVKVQHRGASPKLKRLYVRAGVAHVAPLSSSREMELADVDGAASLAVQNGPIAGSGASVGSATIPALIMGYKLTPRVSLETILGLPFTVKFRATGTLANESIAPMALGIPTGVPALGPELGEAKAAPPTVTATYALGQGSIVPYVGAGVAVLFAFDAKVTNALLTEVSQPEFTVKPAPGLVFQAGAEAKLWKNIYARLDVKFIALMLAQAEAKHIQVRTPELPLFDTVEVGTARMSVWVNPLIIQAGIGADF